jgi:predicted nucleic acid-binding protein
MIVLLDTNIMLDALQERQPFDVEAKDILWRSQNGEFKCCFTANAATDIFYLYSKARDSQSARSAMDFILSHYEVVSVTHEDCVAALASPMNDFEDALVAVCAKKAGVDFIVTRDEEFLLAASPVPLISPAELLNRLK